MTIRLAGVVIGRRNAAERADADRHHDRLYRDVEVGRRRQRDRDEDQRGRRVGDHRADDRGEHEDAEEEERGDSSRRRRRRGAVAASSAAPLTCIAVEIGIMPATRMTVVHEIPWYACAGVRTPSATIAVAATRPATTGGTQPVARSTTITSVTPMASADRSPNGTAWRRTRPGSSIARTSRSASTSRSMRLPLALHEQDVAGLQAHLAWAAVLAASLDGEDDEVAALGDHAGEDGVADHRRPRRHDDFDDADPAPDEVRVELERRGGALEPGAPIRTVRARRSGRGRSGRRPTATPLGPLQPVGRLDADDLARRVSADGLQLGDRSSDGSSTPRPHRTARRRRRGGRRRPGFGRAR